MHHALLHQSTISTTTRVDRVDLPAHVTHSNSACAPTCSTVC
ncbi:hypothetical protein Ahy_B01g053771 isoform E [Arachis hypogaea]|uniref:Uncharacterized protein n=1 Tax=Arachis hypogaea TaxID=3818 RepID=A0A445ASH9_ARAHY|nr:hypothetical protein Ahy_B01g053771 isoform E [Arachis hypogaea]